MNQRIDPYTGREIGPIEAPSYLQGLPTMRAQPKQGPIGAGLSTGRRELQGLAGDFVGAVGNVTGLEGVQRAGEAYADDRFAAAAGTARQDLAVPPWESRDTPIGSWLAYETARQVPQLAAQLVAGRLVPKNASPKALERAGASLPRALGGGGAKPNMSVAQRREAVKQGQEFSRTAVGAVATGYPLGVGAMYGEAREAGEPTQGDAARALAMGLPYAALDAFQPVQLQGILRQGLKGNIVRRIATAGVVGGVAEMPQEAVQTAMELTFRPDMSGPEKMRQIVNAALTGAAVGGVIGGAGGLRRLKSIDPAAMTNDTMQEFVDEATSVAPDKGLSPAGQAYNQMVEAGSYPAQPVDPMVRMTATDPMASEAERLQTLSRVADPRVRPEDIGQQFDPLAQLPEAAGEVRTDERPLVDVPDAELRRAYELVQSQGAMVADERGARAIDAITQEMQIRAAEQQAAPTQAATQQDTDAAVTEMRARAKQLAGGRDTKFTRELDARNETELTARVIERLEEGADDASLMRLAEGLGVLDANGQPRDIGAEVQQAEARLQQMQTRLERTGEGAAIADAYSRRLDALRQEQTRLDAAVRLSRGEVDAVQPAQASEQGDVQGAAPTQPPAQAEAVPAAEQQVEPAAPTAAPPARSTAPVAQLAETAANVEPVGAIGEQLRNLLGMQARRDEFSEAQGQQLEQRTTQVQRAQAEPVRVQSLQRSGARANVTLSNGERVVAERRTRQGGDIEGWYGPNDEYLGSTLQDVRSSLVEQANSSGEQRPAPTEDTRIDMRGRTGPRATIRRFRAPEGSELARRAERPNDPRMAPERLKKLKTAVKRELKRTGMSERVAVDITDRLDAALNGLYEDGRITIDALMDDVEVIGALRHELIHALRDPDIWGKPYGLFTKQEWDTLVAAARERPDIVNFVEANYADQPTDVREEEMVAELYRTWAAGRPADSMIQRIMDKIHEAIHGMIAAFEGAGEYRSAQLLLRVANGTIGARAPSPQGPGLIRRAQRAWHGTQGVFDRFSLDFLGTGVGRQAYGWGLYFSSQKDMAAAYRAKMARKHGTQTFNLPDSTRYGPDRPGHAHIKGLFETYPTVTQMARDRRRGSLEENLKESRAYLQKVRRDGNLPFEEQNIQREIEALEDAISVIDTVEVAPGGTLFEVEIPNDDRLMDFDATLANQPPQVREAMMSVRPIVPDTNWVDDDAGTAVYAESEDGRTIGAIQIDPATNEYTVLFTDFRGGYVRVGSYPDADAAVDAMAAYDPPPILEGVPDQMPAYQAYQLIGEALTPRTARASDTQKAASLALVEAGVPGHIYRELNSTDDADRNFVIYDEDAIKVVGRQSRKGVGAKLTSPVEQADMAANGAVTTLQNRAQQALAKMTTGDFSALSTAGRNAMLYASTLGHISDFFGGMFKSGSIKKLLDAHRTRVTLEQQMAHLSLIPYHSFERLERSDAASAEQIRFLMGMTEFNIDPRRPWRDQTWLHQDPMADKLQQHAVKAHRIYKNLEQRGKLQTYTGFLQVNEMMHFAQQAMSLYHTAMAQPGAAKLMGYDSSPMLDFMQRSDLHESPEKARAYWQGVTKELIDKATKFEMTQRGLTGSMTAQDIKMFETHTSSIKRRIATIKEQQEAMERAPYFHLGRFGDYFVAFSVRGAERTVNGKKVRTPDRKAMQLVAKELERAGIRGVTISEDTARDNVFLRFENETQMNNAFETVQMLKKRGLLSENREPQRGRRTSETDPTRAQEQIAALRDYIKSSPAFQETDDMTPEQAEKVKYARNQMEAHINAFALDLLPDTSIGKVMVHRDSVPGYSSDMVRSYAFRTQVGAHALANLSASPLLSDAFTGMKTDINDAKVDPDQDVVAMQDVMGELMTREANRPTESGHNFLDTMRAFNHAYFLGMSPSYVLVNMTQIPVLLWPELAKGHGFAKSFQAIAKVTPLALKVVKAAIQRGVGMGPRRAADSTVTDSALQRAGIGKTDREFIMRIVNTGVIDIGSASREHGRIVEDRLDSNTDLALRYASAAGFYSEMTSRLVAALATRELESKKGLDPAQLQERVVKTVDQSMLNYSTYYVSRMSGKSGFAGPVTPLMLAFLQYSFQLTEKLFRELHTGFISKANTKAEKQQARRFLAAHLTSITALAGTLGLPMATVFARVINSMVDLLGDDEEPYDVVSSYRNMLSDVFGKEVGEIIARGAPRAAGFDISRRVGEQDILPFSRLIADRRAWDDALKDWAVDSLGSPFSMMASIAKGGSEIARGNLLDGMKEAMPVALKGPIEAYRMSERGYVDRSGTALPMEVGARDILTQALGFSTAEKAEYSEAKMAQTVRKGLLVREAANLRKNIAVAIESGDRAKAQEWLAKARSFDLTNPGYAVLPGLSSAMTSRARARALSEASGLPLGTNMRDPGAASLTDYANFQP